MSDPKKNDVLRLLTGELSQEEMDELQEQIADNPILMDLYTKLQSVYQEARLEREHPHVHFPRGETKRYDNLQILTAKQQLAHKMSSTSSAPPSPPSIEWKATLTIQSETSTTIHQLKSGTTLIGAMMPCRIRIDDPLVSGIHARFLFSSHTGSLWIEDLDSTNGTFILQDSERIQIPHPFEVVGRNYSLTSPLEIQDQTLLFLGNTTISVSIEKIERKTP